MSALQTADDIARLDVSLATDEVIGRALEWSSGVRPEFRNFPRHPGAQ